VISKHVKIDQDKVQIKLDRGASVSTLEIDVEVPGLKSLARPTDRPEAQPAPG
jgi:cell division topological specificity factor